MHTAFSSHRVIPGLVALGVALVLPAPRATAAGTPAQADAFPNYESYIKVSGQAPWVTGDSAAFKSRTGTPSLGSGGIEDFFYAKDLSDNSSITVNGHALAGVEDYLGTFKLDESKVGSAEVGYSRFRTFYDGIGGFFPLANQFNRLSPESLHVDRSKFWVDLKLAMPDLPVFTFSFRDEIRTGMKDSTEWSPIINPNAVVTAGALVGTASPVNTPYIGPNVQTLDEHHDTFEAGVAATIGKTTADFKASVETVNNLDGRGYVRYPNSIVTANPTVTVQDDLESRKSTNVRLVNQTNTQLTDQLAVDVGLNYTHLTSTNGGNWITPTYNATAKGIYPAETAAKIYGGSKLDQYVGNIFLKYTPTRDWHAELGFREEASVVTSNGGFETSTLASGATSVAPSNINTSKDITYSRYADRIATPEISLEYSGFKRLSLYATFDDCINRGKQHWINPYVVSTTTGAGVVTTASASPGSVFFQDANQDYEDAKIGANWNVSSQLTIRAEVFRKDHKNQFIGATDIIGTASYGGLYMTGYSLNGAKLSIIYKPLPELTFNTRYQPQAGEMSVTGNTVTDGLGTEVTSGQLRIQEISESINWTPSTQIYLQGNVNLVYNSIQTTYPVVVVSTSTSVPTPFNNADNNYVTASALCGFVVDKETDAQLQGSWTRANNYNPQVALGGQAYGAGFEETRVTAGLKHKFSDRLIGEGKVGYIRMTNSTTGGFTNFHGPLAYVSLTYSL